MKYDPAQPVEFVDVAAEFHFRDADRILNTPLPTLTLGSRKDCTSVGIYNPLSRDDLQICFNKMNYLLFKAEQARQAGDHVTAELLLADADKPRQIIINANLRMVPFMANRMKRSTDEMGELISDGFMVLLKCVGRYDSRCGAAFSTYVLRALEHEFRRRPSVQARQRTRYKTCSDDRQYWRQVDDPQATDAIIKMMGDEDRDLVRWMLPRLFERERDLVTARFGLDREQETVKEIGIRYGFTKSNAGARLQAAINHCRVILRAKEIDFRHRRGRMGSVQRTA